MAETLSSIPHKIIGVGVIWNRDFGSQEALGNREILIARRLNSGEMGGLWEFPGGKIEPNETIEECIRREIKEELDIEVAVCDRITAIDHDYTTFKVTLFVHHCQYLSGEPQNLESEEVRWVKIEELDRYAFPKANIKIIDLLKMQAK